MSTKSCLIIGGGRGMGAATAREMHNRGYKLTLMSPSESCEQLAKELNSVAQRGFAENLSDLESIVELAIGTYNQIDSVLIHVGRST